MNDNVFGLATQICTVATAVLALLTIWTWIRQSDWRFSMVGYTAFAVVLTVGCFGLSLGPIMRTTIPGAARFTTVFDRGSNQVVIAVQPTITPEQLELTLQQAASNSLTSGRFASGSPMFSVRARTLLHPDPGVSMPLYLGQLQQQMGLRNDPDRQIEIYPTAFAQLPRLNSPSANPA